MYRVCNESMCSNHLNCGYCQKCEVIAQCFRDGPEAWREMNWKQFIYTKCRQEKARRDWEKECRMITGAGVKHRHWTINLPKDYDLVQMKNLTEELVFNNLYKLGNSIATYEYYGKQGEHPHVHLVTTQEKPKKPSVVIENLSKKFGIKQNFIEYSLGKPEDFKNRMNYVLGNKVDPDKKEQCLKDREWRDDHSLPHVTCSLPETILKKFEEKTLEFT